MSEKELEKQSEPVEAAPDPEEDDLDDLDDVLDEFAGTKLDSKPSGPPSSGPGRPSAAPPPSVPAEDEFAKQLEAGMADLLGELESSPELQKQFEDMMKGLGDAASAADASGSKDAAASDSKEANNKVDETSFQDTIKRTMDRMLESDDQASAAAVSAGDDDILARMLQEMEKGGLGEEGNDEDFSKILMGMMEQLTNKEILYEPMKELRDKFPLWLEQNRAKVEKDDLKRYEEQNQLVTEIVARFERSGYSDTNTADREYIVERMQKMQAAGSPPPDLVGDMNAAQEALGEIDAGCPQQ